MQYQISYFSPGGYAESLAKAFCRHLPGDTYVSSLEQEDTPYADIQLVGFDYAGTCPGAVISGDCICVRSSLRRPFWRS